MVSFLRDVVLLPSLLKFSCAPCEPYYDWFRDHVSFWVKLEYQEKDLVSCNKLVINQGINWGPICKSFSSSSRSRIKHIKINWRAYLLVIVTGISRTILQMAQSAGYAQSTIEIWPRRKKFRGNSNFPRKTAYWHDWGLVKNAWIPFNTERVNAVTTTCTKELVKGLKRWKNDGDRH